MKSDVVLHETARRLRLAIAAQADTDALRAQLEQLAGVESVRVNSRLSCMVVHHDGREATRAAVLERLAATPRAARRRSRMPRSAGSAKAGWVPAMLAVSVPLLPRDWRSAGALATVAARVATQPQRLRQDAPAVLLDAASLASLAVSGQPVVVSASVLLRLLAERLSDRLVGEADRLLARLLPIEAERYQVLRDADAAGEWSAWPLRELRRGDRLRLFPGDVVPVDGCVLDGAATVMAAAHHAEPRELLPGDHVAAGEQLQEGTLEVRAEADVPSSRLERLRAHVRHALASREPLGRMSPDLDRLVSLPLTAAALVLGLTGDTARAGAMLQADPQQGLDLALPLARESALYALARQGLLAAGLEAIERLAVASTLVLQDTGVLAGGRWIIDAVDTEAGGDAETVRAWLAALADTPVEHLAQAGFPDRVVREWMRHGALLRLGEHEVHLASAQRLQRVWGIAVPSAAPAVSPPRLQRELAVVAGGRVVARVLLGCALRPEARERLRELAGLGFQQVAVFAEDDGSPLAAPCLSRMAAWQDVECVAGDGATRADWLADRVSDGRPAVLVHTVLRDLVPPGSLSLTPTEAEAGAHGVLLGDPLASLVAARRVALAVHRRLRQHHGAAVVLNATLMASAALRWLPPIATSLVHHGFAMLLLIDSMRLERLDAPKPRSMPAKHAAGTQSSRAQNIPQRTRRRTTA
jgi:Cu2+-exporting ATPase